MYNLDHLTQPNDQKIGGPIQDDEALFLYAIVKGMRLNRILEIGGLNGYSSNNFLRSMDQVDGMLYTVDLNPVPVQGPNHKTIEKNALYLTAQDLDNKPLDLVFFDCHDMIQMEIYHRLVNQSIIHDNTIVALHDTNLHYIPFQVCGYLLKEEEGYVHQPVEREMVNILKDLGYDIFMLHTTKEKHSDKFPFRHGITICQKFNRLKL